MMHGFIPPDRFFPYLTWTEIESMPNKENTVVIQPIGAIEQHGPHLPLVVDAAIATAVLGKAFQSLRADLPAYALPTLFYGKSNEHVHFPGTITLSATTLITLLMEVGESLYRAGFRKWVLLNGHGGQPQILDLVARDLHCQHPDFTVFPLFVWRVPNLASQLLSAKEMTLGIHAGDAETSLMLALLPEQVNMDKALAEYPPELPPDSLISLEGNLPFAWVTRDLSKSGVIGDATIATPEKGEQLLDSLAESWTQVIEAIYQFQPPQAWKAGP